VRCGWAGSPWICGAAAIAAHSLEPSRRTRSCSARPSRWT
jgi:hypothetical protein